MFCAWAGAAAVDGAPAMEPLRNLAIAAFLWQLLGLQWYRPAALAAMVMALVDAGGLAAGQPLWSALGRIGMAVYGLVLVESLFRATRADERWAVKFLCLGFGGIFAYDLYLYSDASMMRRIDTDLWAARGLVDALCVPLVVAGSLRTAAARRQLTLSHQLVVRSAALIGSALYLLAMGSAGYALRLAGGSWGAVMQLAFLFGAALLLAGALFSGTFRSWLRVVVAKHFFRYRYDYREQWLRFSASLSGGEAPVRERVVHAMALLVDSPGGALWTRRHDGDFALSARRNLPQAEVLVPAGSPFCRALAVRQWVFDLSRPGEQPGDVPSALRAFPQAWLVVPLALGETLVGFVLLARPRSHAVVDWETIDLLRVAGRQAASFLAQQESSDALALSRQFESLNRMSAFVVHDIKNLLGQLSLLARNAPRHGHDPEFQRDMAQTLVDAVERGRHLLSRLARPVMAPAVLEMLDLREAVRTAVAGKVGRVKLELPSQSLPVLADRERLVRVIGHLVQNALEATAGGGSVDVVLAPGADGFAELTVSDTGAGMTPQFLRERLFQPFATTKADGMGIGVFEVREYVHEIGGRVEVESEPGKGTRFRILLPAPASGAGGEHDLV
ncbi:MAG: XrtA/PEP-CTERM system histidine kinase PrsK [Telluria sp.]